MTMDSETNLLISALANRPNRIEHMMNTSHINRLAESHHSQTVQDENIFYNIFQSHKLAYVIVHLFLTLILISSGLVINRKLFKKISSEDKKEKGKILQGIIKTYLIIQIVCWPIINLWEFSLTLVWSLRLDASSLNVLLSIFCQTRYGSVFFYISVRTFVGFNSLIIAICRTIFVVYGQNVEKFGLLKVKRLLFCGSLLFPLLLVVLFNASHEAPYMDGPHTKCNELYRSLYKMTDDFDKHQLKANALPSLYTMVNKYVSPVVISFMKIFSNVTILIMGSNLIEGFLYFHTFRYIKR